MSVDLPTVVVEAHAETPAAMTVRPLSALGEVQRRALGAYSDATSIHAVDLPEQAADNALPGDPLRAARILRIEEALRAARGPLDVGDRDALATVQLRVSTAYSEARAHPEDAEAPFLVAEALRTLARIEDLNADVIGARALRRRADLLDGGRLIGLSEGGPLQSATGASVSLTVTLTDATASSVLLVDGEVRPAGKAIALLPGEHHLRVTAHGATLSAQFLTLTTETELTLAGGAARTPCAAADLAAALAAVPNSFAVVCPRWARIVQQKSAIEIRICSSTSCGASTTWSTVPLAAPPPFVGERSVWSSRWTWVSIGAAALVGGTVTAWSLGAFDRGDRPAPTWRWDGAR